MRNYSGDGITSVYLAAVGWKTKYVPETVQWGLVPDTARKHSRQRIRWTAVFISRISALWSERTKGHASIQQRAGATVSSVVVVFTNSLIAFSAVAIPWVLFTGAQTVIYQTPRQLQVLLYLESLAFLAALFSGVFRSRSGRSCGHIFLDWEHVGVSPFQAVTIIRVTVSELISSKMQSFAPSSESTLSNRSNWFTSLIRYADVDLLANLLIFSAHSAGGYIGLRTIVAAAETKGILQSFFSQAGYPALFLLWGKYMIQSGTVIPLMISSQPIWPIRENNLIRDPVSMVAYPSEEAINPQRIGAAQTFAKFAFFYHCVVLVSAWSI